MKFSLKLPKRKKQSQVVIGQGSAPLYTNPVREWTIGLGVALLCLIGGVVGIAFDFRTQFGATSEEAAYEQKASTYQANEILFYAQQYTDRENAFNVLRKNGKGEVVSETRTEVAVPEAVVSEEEIIEPGNTTEIDTVEQVTVPLVEH